MTVIGTKKGSFKDRQSGESVSYGRVYVVYDFPANYDGTAQTGVAGRMCEELKVPVECLDGLKLNEEILPRYNRYGRVEGIEKVDK